MRATDIVRRRRVIARRKDSRGRRLWRAAALAVLWVLLAALLVPIAGAAAGAAGLLALTRDMPNIDTLRHLPADYRPSAATTRLYAREAPGGDLILIDEIADPRRDAGWARAVELPPHVTAAYLAALGQPAAPTASRSITAVALEAFEWWRDDAIGDAPSPLASHLVRTQLRDGEAAGDPRRAFQDWLLGRRIDASFTVAQQAEWALNTDYYGHLAYGIEAAARVYFGKRATDLTAGEAAALAAATRNPAANPFDDPAAAEAGRAAVLAAMAARGDLPTADATEAAARALALVSPPGSASPHPSFVRLARRQLEQLLGPARLLAGNLDVETTLDPAMQAQVECAAQAFAASLPSGGGPPCPAAEYLPLDLANEAASSPPAIVVLEPTSGDIAALAGDVDIPHPTGTLARPFVYLTALSQGYSAAALLMDVESIYLQAGQPYTPRDPDGRFLGPLRLREAAAANRAAPAAQALGWVGNERVLATARALGARPTEAAAGLALIDNGFSATLLDLSGAFATIGNGGAAAGAGHDGDPPRPTTIRQVLDSQGQAIYTRQASTRETLAPELAYLMTDILADASAQCPAAGCPGEPALPDGRPLALVRGQSAGGNQWAIGYTPERLVGVRVEGEAAAPLWQALMAWASSGEPESEWPRPPRLRRVEVCAVSGLLPSPTADCSTVREWFIPGTEPSAVDTMTREAAVNRESGRLATIFTPPQLIERRSYVVYPPEATAWAEEAGIEPPPVEYDTIRRIPTRVGSAELNVEPWSVISGQWSMAGSAGGDQFAYFRLAYFPGLLPEAMQTVVARNETPVASAELGVWDTTLLEDGLYTLLLTVVRGDGTFDEVAVPLTVANGNR